MRVLTGRQRTVSAGFAPNRRARRLHPQRYPVERLPRFRSIWFSCFGAARRDVPVAIYPSPAGPTESLLSLEAWNDLAERNPVLAELEPDVEALLVNRTQGAREYYRVSIDRCYALVGLIRKRWRGLSGSAEAWRRFTAFSLRLAQAPCRGTSSMVDLDFAVLDVEVERYAMSPQLVFRLQVSSRTPEVAILNVMLNCQLRIEPALRTYGEAEHDSLSDLFGAKERWGQTLLTVWTTPALRPAFDGIASSLFARHAASTSTSPRRGISRLSRTAGSR